MEQLLQPHIQYTAIYIDDIVVYSTGWKAHLLHLIAAIQTVNEAGLIVNSTKCRLGERKVMYLRYTMGQG